MFPQPVNDVCAHASTRTIAYEVMRHRLFSGERGHISMGTTTPSVLLPQMELLGVDPSRVTVIKGKVDAPEFIDTVLAVQPHGIIHLAGLQMPTCRENPLLGAQVRACLTRDNDATVVPAIIDHASANV